VVSSFESMYLYQVLRISYISFYCSQVSVWMMPQFNSYDSKAEDEINLTVNLPYLCLINTYFWPRGQERLRGAWLKDSAVHSLVAIETRPTLHAHGTGSRPHGISATLLSSSKPAISVSNSYLPLYSCQTSPPSPLSPHPLTTKHPQPHAHQPHTLDHHTARPYYPHASSTQSVVR